MSPAQKPSYAVDALEGYVPEIGHALWALEETRRRTKSVLKHIDPEAIDWAPPQGGNRIGTLLYHIAEIEMDWLYVEVLQSALPPEVQALFPYEVQDAPSPLTEILGIGLDEHLRRLDATRAIFLRTFREMTLEEFRRLRRLDSYDVTPEWIVYHLIQHESEHRGQIAQLRKSRPTRYQ
jgi:uncharacterized damage-inducible protein DinB